MSTTIAPAIFLGIIGILATLISVITEVTKKLGFLAKIPTDLQVIVLSIILSLLTYFGYVSYAGIPVVWYLVVLTIIGSFVVAFITMFGWAKLMELYNRFKPSETITDAADDVTETTTNIINEVKSVAYDTPTTPATTVANATEKLIE